MGADENLWFTVNDRTGRVLDFELDKIQHASIQSITKLKDNSILVSGKFRTGQGEEDIFIQNYSPFQSYLWGKSYHSHFNDKTLKHIVKPHKIYLPALIYSKYNYQKIALFSLDRYKKNKKNP
jgi:hypothetical protein